MNSRTAWNSLCLLSTACATSDAAPITPITTELRACETLAVINSDYVSTNVAIADLRGGLLSSSIISSGSQTAGLSAALSGDVALAHDAPSSGELVLIDRFPAGVITWIDPKSAQVQHQLNVATGFAANPHDYLEISPNKAYVTRYNRNPAPGKVPMDEGSDLLVIDPQVPAIRSRISLSAYAGTTLPRPDRMTRIGTRVVVMLGHIDATYTHAEDAALVVIDPTTDAITESHSLIGLKNCGGLALNLAKTKLAISCSGVFPARNSSSPASDRERQRSESGVVVLEANSLQELDRYPAAGITQVTIGGPVTPYISFASDNVLMASSYGDLSLNLHDIFVRIDLATRTVSPISEASSAFVYGDIACGGLCGSRCAMADAANGSIKFFNSAGTEDGAPLVLSKSLPPRLLSGLGH